MKKLFVVFCLVIPAVQAATRVRCSWIVGAAAYYNATTRVEELGIAVSEEGQQLAALLEQLSQGRVSVTALDFTHRPVSDSERIDRALNVIRSLDKYMPPATLLDAQEMPKAFVAVPPAAPRYTQNIRTRLKVLEHRLSVALSGGNVSHLLAPPLVFSGSEFGESAACLFYDRKHGVISYSLQSLGRFNKGLLKCALGAGIGAGVSVAAVNNMIPSKTLRGPRPEASSPELRESGTCSWAPRR